MNLKQRYTAFKNSAENGKRKNFNATNIANEAALVARHRTENQFLA